MLIFHIHVNGSERVNHPQLPQPQPWHVVSSQEVHQNPGFSEPSSRRSPLRSHQPARDGRNWGHGLDAPSDPLDPWEAARDMWPKIPSGTLAGSIDDLISSQESQTHFLWGDLEALWRPSHATQNESKALGWLMIQITAGLSISNYVNIHTSMGW